MGPMEAPAPPEGGIQSLIGEDLPERAGVRYHLTSCDYLDFQPRLIDEA